MPTKRFLLVAATMVLSLGTGDAFGQDSTEQLKYRVNYRPSDKDPWQLYAQARTQDKANAIADEVKQSGYLAEVVPSTTPTPQPYPDATETSASGYYPTSNWTNDYNYYSVPGGSNYGYNWYGGWYPWNRYHMYPNYAWNGGNNWNSGWYRGYGWNGGWNRGGYGWNNSHRNWNYNHSSRGSHYAHHERHGYNAHHGYAGHRATAGHHTAGHHAAASHSSHHSSEHRGSGHFPNGGRTGGHNGGHRAGGHSFHGGGGHRGTAGRHAGGQHARHLDP